MKKTVTWQTKTQDERIPMTRRQSRKIRKRRQTTNTIKNKGSTKMDMTLKCPKNI